MQVNERSRHPGQTGFTLMELMVTMAIAATLMGLGAGVFLSMGRKTAADTALANVSDRIVNVRNTSSRFPAAILVEPTTSERSGTITAMSQEVRQELHFDPRKVEGLPEPVVSQGIEGRDCDFIGNRVEPTAGRVGGALRLNQSRVDCGRFAAYDVTDGLTIELWMKPDSPMPADLVTKGDALVVRLEASRAGGSRITARIGVADEHGTEKASVTGEIPQILGNQWLGVRVSYDRNQLTIATDTGYGWVQRAAKAETRRLAPSPDAALLIGGFTGLLDDVRFAGVHAAEPVTMPNGVVLVGEKPYTIHFIGGRLDPAVHLGTEKISLEYLGRRTSLEIAQNGMMSVSYADVAAGGGKADDHSGKPSPGKLPEKE